MNTDFTDFAILNLSRTFLLRLKFSTDLYAIRQGAKIRNKIDV